MNLRFTSLALGGDAVGRSEEGLAVFVPFGAPGELAEVEITERRRNFARGRLLRVIEPSAERVEPPCPRFGACGGCRFQHVNYETEVRQKTAMVADALARIGGIARGTVRDTIAAPDPWHYRNRAGFVVAPNRALHGGPGEAAHEPVPAVSIGFHAEGTHRVVDVEHCAIQAPEANAVLGAARELAVQGMLAGVESLDVRVAGGRAVLILEGALRRGDARNIAAALEARVPALGGVLLRQAGHRGGTPPPGRGALPDIVSGSPWLTERIAGHEWRVHAASFFQVNPAQAAVLLDTVLAFAALEGHERVIDAYAGTGFFTVPIAARGCEVAAIEGAREAALDAAHNLAAFAGARARYLHDSVERGLRRLRREGFAPDLVVLDPPRTGARDAVPGVVELAPRRIVYVSCDPGTLARDLRALGESGYGVLAAQPIDMFPRTAHVETVVLLERGPGSGDTRRRSAGRLTENDGARRPRSPSATRAGVDAPGGIELP